MTYGVERMVSPLLKLTLRQGSVYYLQHRDLTSPEPHYLVVVNSSPLKSPVLVFGVVTSKVELKRKRIEYAKLPPETLVLISPSEYSELRVESAIDCNNPRKMSIEELDTVCAYSRKCIDIPAEICTKILEGIMKSPMVDVSTKEMLTRQ
jgi:hypothetical protein